MMMLSKMILRNIYIVLAFLCVAPVYAQGDIPPAAPVAPVVVDSLPLPNMPKVQEVSKSTGEVSSNLAVLELFSTQACVFCPKADAMMKNLIERDDLIALSCHVDYFDVGSGSRALPFCSTRQIAYEKSLDQGPKYTPQMIVNGQYDVIGYKQEEVNATLAKLESQPIKRGTIMQSEHGLYRVSLPDMDFIQDRNYEVWLMVFDLPQKVKIADGGNIGQEITYYNLVSNVGLLGKWNGQSKEIIFDAKLNQESKGFAVIVQEMQKNHVVVAAQYLK